MSGMSKLDYNFQMLLVILMVIITMIAAGALGAMIGFLFLIG
jgi:flagellar basal body-associated protein FliL